MRRRPVILLAASAALVAGAAVTVPAQAAPPSRSGDYSAPYEANAFWGKTIACTAGASCTAFGSADQATGRGTSTSTFERTVAAGDKESVFGYASQAIVFKVPPGVREVTATFTWRDIDGSVSASSTSGLVQAFTGLEAYAANCAGDCTTQRAYTPVQYAGSRNGLPDPGSGLPAQRDASLTVTATGKLPRFLVMHAYPYSVAYGGPSQVCLYAAETCRTVSDTHAGTATANIRATLSGVRVTSS